MHKDGKEEATQVELEPAETIDASVQACPNSNAVAVQASSKDCEREDFGTTNRNTNVPTARTAQGRPAVSIKAKQPDADNDSSFLIKEVLMDADRLRAVDLTAHVHALLQAGKVDTHCMQVLSHLLQDMVHPREGSELPSESASTTKLNKHKKCPEASRHLRPQSESPRPRPVSNDRAERPWMPVSSQRQPSPTEISRPEGLAKKALAQTADVRKLLADELRKPRQTSRARTQVPVRTCAASRSQKSLERPPFGQSTRKW